MSTSSVSGALAGFFASTWPSDAVPVEPDGLDRVTWNSLSEIGLHLVDIEENLGGSGGDLADLVQIAILCGRHAVDLPVVESHLAAWVMARSGLEIDSAHAYSVPLGPVDVTVNDAGHASGVLRDVPWGGSVDRVVAVTGDGHLIVVDPARAQVASGRDLAGQPRDRLLLNEVAVTRVSSAVPRDELVLRTALLRVSQMAGALQAAAEMTRRYTGERFQFGKPIGAFQAVQAHLVELQQMAVMTTSLAERLAVQPQLRAFDVMAAKLVANENAMAAARAAHQAHGAIGMTREYRLHLLTRRLHSWRGDGGDTLTLSARLGAATAAAPSFAAAVLDEDHRPEVRP
ncbi:acyl-CoA dehydrogenase [Thermomonospora echinospora]|uniref:Acyl-CoA dehydrogenase n=1 Tax=Thermomonospora echinospora TaxID=1992 RepID=A0A1H6DZA2_9ACTN|nr:acyl-CoA dehydrogenase family protein [Thermomonospora echinospora]SEG90511.1 acyl-CoA dehydrogenase [Thermomonospora echinospora]